MGTTLNRHAYQRLIDENLCWLERQPRTLERDHVMDIVRLSPSREYDVLFKLEDIRNALRTKSMSDDPFRTLELIDEAIEIIRPTRAGRAQQRKENPTAMKPRPVGAMAVIIKDTSLLSGTIGNNIAAMMTKTLDAANDPDRLAYQESLATCLMLAIFEVFGVPAHSRIPDPAIMQETLNRMAVEFGLDEDTFTIKFWEVESELET